MVVKIDLTGQTVVVTGGNRGIGLGVVRKAAQAGANIALIYRSSTDAVKVGEDFAKEFNVRVIAYQCDVTDQRAVNDTFQKIWTDFGGINGVVANAGVNIQKAALDIDKEIYDSVMGPNVWGVFATAQAAARLWKEHEFKSGKLVFMSSVGATVVAPGTAQTFYNTSKGALTVLAKVLAMEWAPLGIVVNNVSPGLINTDLVAKFFEQYPDLKQTFIDQTMLKRVGEADEVGNTTLFLLSDLATYFTGSQLLMDGGMSSW